LAKKTQELLTEYFGTTEKIRQASLEDLQEVPKLKKPLAKKIYLYFSDNN